MQISGICSYCGGEAKPAYSCILCGGIVCSRDFLPEKSICKRCSSRVME